MKEVFATGMYTLLLTPLTEEFTPLNEALSAMGYRPASNNFGKLSVYEIKELKLYLAQSGHGKTQFGIQTQYIVN